MCCFNEIENGSKMRIAHEKGSFFAVFFGPTFSFNKLKRLSLFSLYIFGRDWPRHKQKTFGKNSNWLFSISEYHVIDHQFCVTAFERLWMHAIKRFFIPRIEVLETSISSAQLCCSPVQSRSPTVIWTWIAWKLLGSARFNRHSAIFCSCCFHSFFINHALIKSIRTIADFNCENHQWRLLFTAYAGKWSKSSELNVRILSWYWRWMTKSQCTNFSIRSAYERIRRKKVASNWFYFMVRCV